MAITGTKDQLLINLMSASTKRFKVLSTNLSNQSTPGYVRSTVAFEDLLASELQERKPDLLSVTPEVIEDTLTPGSPDGNNVNPELEMNGLMQNRLQFELYTTLLAGRMELLRTAIDGGR
ncbi:MAG: flagellar basal-body rod protein FlgB [Candidatus Paceibacteria bacterium]|jgi:flagellar basal-body rod protein FlgB